MKKSLIAGALIALLSTSICFADTNIVINNTPIQFTKTTGHPFIDGTNHTLVPMRIVMEKYGCTVGWNQDEQIAIITKSNNTVIVPIGKDYIIVNGNQIINEATAQVINGKTYLPIRSVLESFGATVDWDNKNKSVMISNGVGENGVTKTIDSSVNSTTAFDEKGYNEFLSHFDIEVRHIEDGHYSIDDTMLKFKSMTKEEGIVYLNSISRDVLGTYCSKLMANNYTGKDTVYLHFYVDELITENVVGLCDKYFSCWDKSPKTVEELNKLPVGWMF